MNIFVCGCFEDKFNSIKVTTSVGEDYFKIFNGNDLYIFCVDIARFCYKVNRWYFFTRTCAFNSFDLFSCYVSLNFGVKSLCSICIEPLVEKLFPYLKKI